MKHIILASGSEWRQKMTSWLDVKADIVISGFDESQVICDTPEELVEALAVAKAQTVAAKIFDDTIVIGADTVIAFNNEIIGKPKDRKDAKRIIEQLSGQTHQVWTGVCVINCLDQEKQVISEVSDITFAPMTDKEIESYLDTNEWQGKAGGYQLLKTMQKHIENISGSATNIIGLPLITLTDMLEHAGFQVTVNVKNAIQSHTGYLS